MKQDVDDKLRPREESSTETADVLQETWKGINLPELDVVLLVQAEVHCGVDLILSVEVVLIKFLVFYWVISEFFVLAKLYQIILQLGGVPLDEDVARFLRLLLEL